MALMHCLQTTSSLSPVVKGYTSSAVWRTVDSLLGSNGLFPNFPFTLQDLRSSTVNSRLTMFAQKLPLELLWRRTSFTSLAKAWPDSCTWGGRVWGRTTAGEMEGLTLISCPGRVDGRWLDKGVVVAGWYSWSAKEDWGNEREGGWVNHGVGESWASGRGGVVVVVGNCGGRKDEEVDEHWGWAVNNGEVNKTFERKMGRWTRGQTYRCRHMNWWRWEEICWTRTREREPEII